MSKGRLEAFSDGVFSIAITLLAIEMHPFVADTQGLLHFLPSLLLFILSFITIAIFWVNHYHLTHHSLPMDNHFMWTNMVLLFAITLIPFATTLIGENPESSLALALYSTIVFIGSFAFLGLNYRLHPNETIKSIYRGLVGPVLYGLAIPFSFISIYLTYTILLIPPIYYFFPTQHTHD